VNEINLHNDKELEDEEEAERAQNKGRKSARRQNNTKV